MWYSSNHLIHLEAFLEVVHILPLSKCELTHRADCTTPAMQTRIENHHAHFYQPMHADDGASYRRNLDLLQTEIGKPWPRMDVMKELMCGTFPNSWDVTIIISLNFYSSIFSQMGSIPKQQAFHLTGILDKSLSAEEGHLRK